jgi:hypothetical protein
VSAVDLAATVVLVLLVAGSLTLFAWRAVRDWRGAGRRDDEDEY